MASPHPKIILASQSKYRAELLAKLGLAFAAEPANIDETARSGETAAELCLRLAESKARTIMARQPAGSPAPIIIGSDQVACLATGSDFQLLGKPGTAAKAQDQLTKLSGQRVSFFTSLCVLNCETDELQLGMDETQVQFRTLTEDQIIDYVAREQPLDCAGAFKSEALGIALFETLETKDPNALIGLPLIQLCGMLAKAGVAVLGR